ncbi:MAG: hypothetical protein H5U13_00450 [Parvibaculum sp.]|nr:hypothetical protein [Parvibaculum sp.]
MAEKNPYASEIAALASVLESLSALESEAQEWVLGTAANRLGLTLRGSSQKRESEAGGGQGSSGEEGLGDDVSPKEFVKSKAPVSDVQRVACLAYYLTRFRQVAAFKSRDITELNTEAAGPKFNISRAVDNATKQSGFLSQAGKGQKQITAYGEEFVEALPDQEVASQVTVSGKPKRRTRKSSRKAPARKK